MDSEMWQLQNMARTKHMPIAKFWLRKVWLETKQTLSRHARVPDNTTSLLTWGLAGGGNDVSIPNKL
jgi:hypothetical protein